MLAEQLKQLRTSRNLSQVDLAEKLGVSKQSVSNWENNNIVPSIEMLIRIAELFSVSTDCVLGLDTRQYMEVTGLSDAQIAHVQQLIDDITGK